MPMLLLIFMGIFSFGLYVWNYEALTQGVGIGAQYLSTIRGDTLITDPCAAVFTAITSAAPSLNPSKISLSFTLTGASPTGNTCPGDQAYLQSGLPVTVQATYPCTLIYFATSCVLQTQMTVYEY
jgi:predicted small integral membrane protein